MEWKTRITEMLGCKYPIIGGALEGISTSALAAPISEAGGFGLLCATCYSTPDDIKADIRKCREMTDKPFGVNLTIGLCAQADEMLEASLKEGIKIFETSALPAQELGKRIHEAGGKWLHKVTNTKHVLATEKQGADAVGIVGMEGIGFKSPTMLPTLIATSLATKEASVPVYTAGGIGDSRTFLAGLATGAEAIYIATGFMTTEESPIPLDYKQKMIEAEATDPDYLGRVLYQPPAEEYNEIMKMKYTHPPDMWIPLLENLVQGYEYVPIEELKKLTPLQAMLRVVRGSLAVAFMDKVVTVKEYIDSIITGAEEIMAGRSWGI
jgi:nitronate monooxygenase